MLSPILNERLLFLAAALLYAIAFGYGLRYLLARQRYQRFSMLTLIGCGFLLQTWGLLLRGMETRACPVGNPAEVLQFVVWSLVLLYLITGTAFRVSLLGFFSSALAAVLGAVSLIPALDPEFAGSAHRNPLIEAHAALAVFSYGIFGLLALTSGMFLLQHYSLRHKASGVVYGLLPSITQLEHMGTRLLVSSMVVYSGAIVPGLLHAQDYPESLTSLKMVFAVSLWFGYAAILALHLRRRLLGPPFAWTCLILFLVALFALWPIESARPIPLPSPAAAANPTPPSP